MKGIWSEAVLFVSPKFANRNEHGFAKVSITHRQYFTLVKNRLSFAYRLNYQGTIAGNAPFFIQPYVINSFSNSSNTDGLGGSKSIRGILRNRVVGDATTFGNVELRWKAWRTVVFNQNFYLGINAFVDAGKVLKKIDVNMDGVPAELRDLYFNPDSEAIHTTAGLGIRFVLNENFIVAVDWGKAFDKRDGNSGLYIGLNYLF
jgi:hemolysin activation/secretion protein